METERQPTDRVMMVLAAMVVFSPVFAIVAANWTDGLEVLWLVALIGMVAGWLISISRFRSLTAHLLSTVYGSTWIGYLLAGPLPYLLWRDRILALYGRLVAWIELALRGGTGRDSLLFILMLSVIAWWLGYTAMWNTARYQRVWRFGHSALCQLVLLSRLQAHRVSDDLLVVRVALGRPFVHGVARTPLGEGGRRLQ
jgi:hypothetical protein